MRFFFTFVDRLFSVSIYCDLKYENALMGLIVIRIIANFRNATLSDRGVQSERFAGRTTAIFFRRNLRHFSTYNWLPG